MANLSLNSSQDDLAEFPSSRPHPIKKNQFEKGYLNQSIVELTFLKSKINCQWFNDDTALTDEMVWSSRTFLTTVIKPAPGRTLSRKVYQ